MPRAYAAAVSCTASMSGDVTFGTIDFINSQISTSNPTLAYTCTNTRNKPMYANVCFNISYGVESQPSGNINPRIMNNGAGDLLQFQLYQDASHTLLWGSVSLAGLNTPLVLKLTIPAKSGGTNGSLSGSASVYGYLLPGQTTLPPGSYQDSFSGSQTNITMKSNKNKMPATCGAAKTGNFPFAATATIVKSCMVSAGPTLDFGSVPSSATNITGQNTIAVTCSNSTPYFIGLAPSNGNTAGLGVMSGTGTNTDKVPYQLNSQSNTGPIWGNTASATRVGNGVGGNGTGQTRSLPVFATAPSANFTPDSYSDTVTVNVNY